jgi:hypothetical protein
MEEAANRCPSTWGVGGRSVRDKGAQVRLLFLREQPLEHVVDGLAGLVRAGRQPALVL